MCGIIGIISQNPVAASLLDALKRLEYRGYDSAGLATLVDGQITRRRAEGKLRNLEHLLAAQPLPGVVGIGHTRWATHGAPNENNAHPHATDAIALVHNGIIENFQELKAELVAKGHPFTTETDTEVIAHLLTDFIRQGLAPRAAMTAALQRLHGAFALAVLFTAEPDHLYGARRGSPLVVGYGDGEMYLGSDALALASLTRRVSYLQEDDWVILSRTGVEIFDSAGQPVQREVVETNLSGALIGKGGYRHFMEKEIFEQPTVIGDTLAAFLDPVDKRLTLPTLPFDISAFSEVSIVACGTSFHAGLVAKYWLESLAGMRTFVDIASEYRYRPFVDQPGRTLAVFISQSGETADTLAALRFAKAHGQKTLAVVNVPSSTMAREADVVLTTLAGPEIGVASTKAFTTQLVVLAALALHLAHVRGKLPPDRLAQLADALLHTPAFCNQILNLNERFLTIARQVVDARTVLYVGRGTSWPIALEGALKLKELSYIHAEGLAAGELKHGPIALIDETVPVVVLAPHDALFEKTASNLQEIAARRGRVILVSDRRGCALLRETITEAIEMPTVDPFVAPLLYTIPVQFLAYHVAVLKGTDVDQPRNLAKSVTVE